MQAQGFFEKITATNQDCLRDESQFKGSADTISYPVQVEQLVQQVKECVQQRVPVTPQASRTGLNGSGVPIKGHVINLSRMNTIVQREHCNQRLDNGMEALGVISVEPGITLEQLDIEVKKYFPEKTLCFPITPTELSATVGGILSSGAGGPRGYYYGTPANYIKTMDVLLANGTIATLQHGTEDFAAVLGGEGMYGIITKAELYLVAQPPMVWGIVFFFSDEEGAVGFSQRVDEYCTAAGEVAATLLSLEYIDRNTVELMEAYRSQLDSISSMPQVPQTAEALVYLELGGTDEEEIMDAAEALMAFSIEYGCDPDESWAMSAEHEVKRLQEYRHMATECITMQMAKIRQQQDGITLICSDICQRGKDKLSMLQAYKKSLEAAGLNYCMYGHIGQNHVYVNILAESKEEYEKGVHLLEGWMHEAATDGGKIWKDHGIGKIKRESYKKTMPVKEVEKFAKDKQRMDPNGVFNPGNGVLE